MSTEYKIYYNDENELYKNKSKEEKERIRLEIVKMAPERAIQPTARYYKTYPSTVRNIMRIYEEKGEEGLKLKK